MKMRNRSSMQTLASIVLAFESFVAFFATLAAFGLKVADPEIVWSVGLSCALLMMLTPAVLRYNWGYWIGSLWQVLLIASGVLLWGMFVIGVMLAGLWIWALIAGSTIDRAKKIYFEMEIEGK
jgi:hypothetical protein